MRTPQNAANFGIGTLVAHDPERWAPVFRNDHAQPWAKTRLRFDLTQSRFSRSTANKKARERPRLFSILQGGTYSPTAAARSCFSTIRADLPRRLRK